MTVEQQSHKLTLDERSRLTMTGVAEVLSVSENLSLDGGQVAVEGAVAALIYEEPRQSGGWLRRVFG